MSVDPEAVNAWIEGNLDTVHSVCDVAAHFACSPRTLERGFAANGDLTVSRCIKDLRLHRIQRLLVSTDLPCCKIAEQVGGGPYESVERAFKRTFGITMSQYRRLRAHRL
jgi:transcriptional regulator GlxA family with amidase domain